MDLTHKGTSSDGTQEDSPFCHGTCPLEHHSSLSQIGGILEGLKHSFVICSRDLIKGMEPANGYVVRKPECVVLLMVFKNFFKCLIILMF